LVLRALLAVMRRVDFSKPNAQDEDEDEDDEGATMNEETSVRAAVCRCVLGLFCDSIVLGSSSASAAATGEPSKQAGIGGGGTTMYDMCGREQRRLMLGLFHYAPWGRNAVPAAAAAASKTVCRALCGVISARGDAADSSLGSGELDYFLRVLHEHRTAFALQDFVNQLLATGRAAVAALSAKAGLGSGSTQAAALERAALLSGPPPLRWHAHCVAEALLRCSSSETPEKIAALLAAPLGAWLDSATPSSAPGAGGGSSSGLQWLKRSATTSAVLAVSMRLLQPCSGDKSSSLIEVAARAALSSVLSAGTAGDARLLSSALDALDSMPPILDAFLALCSATPHDTLLPSLRLLIVLHPIFASKNRESLRGAIAPEGGGAVASPQQGELLQLLARV
jgi:hypothetical protein